MVTMRRSVVSMFMLCLVRDTLTVRMVTMRRSVMTMVVVSDEGHTDCLACSDDKKCGEYGSFIL